MITKEYIEKLMVENIKHINNYKERLGDNFLGNFEWVAEKIFKALWKDKIYEHIYGIYNEEDADVPQAIERLKTRYKEDLISRTLMSSSTNPIHNLTTLWISECKQELLEEL